MKEIKLLSIKNKIIQNLLQDIPLILNLLLQKISEVHSKLKVKQVI